MSWQHGCFEVTYIHVGRRFWLLRHRHTYIHVGKNNKGYDHGSRN